MALKKKQIGKFKEQLLKMREELTAHLGNAKQEVQVPEESKGYSQHQADEGSDDFDRRISLELTSREMDDLRQIDRALEKIEDGTYGVCDISGEEIGIKRLTAIPQATTSLASQKKVEEGTV